MPPKLKISKEDIIKTAIELVRKNGEEAINARAIAKELDCSTQPIFSNFYSMQELKFSVIERADTLCQEYIENEIKAQKYPEYKASGMAYIRFAREERELFKLLYMRDRRGEQDTLGEDALTNKMHDMVNANTGLENDTAKLFHLEMWACVHGIASMVATRFLELDEKIISKIITDIYKGLVKEYKDGSN